MFATVLTTITTIWRPGFILNFVGRAGHGVGCVQVFATQNGDYLMFDNSHYLKTRVETVSTLILHPCLILAK